MRVKKERIPKKNNIGAQSIDRALSILNCFDFHHQTLTASQLSKKLGLTSPTTQRMLRSLVSHRLLEYNDKAGYYQLGFRSFELGCIAQCSIPMIDEAKEIMLKLHHETVQTVRLAIVDGDEFVNISSIDSNDVFGIYSPVGIRRPLVSGSFGKAILSTYPQQYLQEYLLVHTLPALTSNSITDKSLYMNELSIVRARGFATDKEEFCNGVCSVAAPIAGTDGLAIGVIAVTFPVIKFTEAKVAEWGQLVRQGGLSLSKNLS